MEEQSSLFVLSVDEGSKDHLAAAAKWARLFAYVGMAAFVGIVANSIFNHVSSWKARLGEAPDVAETIGSILGFILLALTPLLVVIYALQFANAVQKLMDTNDAQTLNRSLQNLKIFFRYAAIVAIVFTVFMTIAVASNVIGSKSSLINR